MTPTPDPPQTEAETLIARLREAALDERYNYSTHTRELGNLMEQAADALTTALRERDEARTQRDKAISQIARTAHCLLTVQTALEAAERERDEANKRASAALDRQAHWEAAAVEQQDQITTLRAALELAESVYRKNCVAPGEPSSVLDAVQAALAADRESPP